VEAREVFLPHNLPRFPIFRASRETFLVFVFGGAGDGGADGVGGVELLGGFLEGGASGLGSRFRGCVAQGLGVGGQVFVFFVMAVAAAEAAVGLAIILAVYRHKQSVSLQNMNLLKDG